MSEAPVFGNQGNERADAPEHVPVAPNDPSHVEAQPSGQAPAAEPPAQDESAAPAYVNPRDAIAARFKEKRSGHDSQFKPDHVPPFVEHAQQQDERQPQEQAQAAPDAGSQQREAGAPAGEAQPAAAPQGYTFKVRGRDVSVANRDELLRLAEVEPHEAKDYTDAQLTRLAQKHAAALSYIDEGKSFRDQARVAAPAPAAPQAGDQQQQPTQQEPETPNLKDLRRKAIELSQYGSTDEADAAWDVYETARSADEQHRRDAQSRVMSLQEATSRDIRSFEERNQDLMTAPFVREVMTAAAVREMEKELHAHGLTETEIIAAKQSTAHMDAALHALRQLGRPVRSNADILEAAGKEARVALNRPALTQQQQPAAAASRIEEKRQLQAQPTRSGNPAPAAPAPRDETASRKNAIAAMQRARTAPNMKEMGLA